MGKVSIDGRLLIHLPHTDTLIIGTTGHYLTITRHHNIPNPLLMPMIGPGIEPSAYLPQLNGLIPGAGYQIVTIKNKIHKANIMIMPVERFATYVVVIEVP